MISGAHIIFCIIVAAIIFLAGLSGGATGAVIAYWYYLWSFVSFRCTDVYE